jgi:YjbE family integral membrane protein
MFSGDLGSQLYALVQVIWIDLVLAGDNAIIIGLAAAGLPAEQRRKAIMLGIAAAAVLRIIFALITTQLLGIPGIRLFGGLLLVWVCWKMYVDLLARAKGEAHDAHAGEGEAKQKTLFQAMTQIVVADVSMSLDNVLAVAAAAEHHPEILIFGLALSVVLMGVGATMIAKLLDRYPIIGWIGLLVIVKVTVELTGGGAMELLARMGRPFSPAYLDLGLVALPTLQMATLLVMALLALIGWLRYRRPVARPVG